MMQKFHYVIYRFIGPIKGHPLLQYIEDFILPTQSYPVYVKYVPIFSTTICHFEGNVIRTLF